MIERYPVLSKLCLLAALALLFGSALLRAERDELLSRIDSYPHTELVERTEAQVIDHEVGLGALQKVRGLWRFKSSERLTGTLIRYTWQVIDGFSSEEVFQQLAASVEKLPDAKQLFDCQGLSCGHGSQWANRVFRQRILYGRNADQHYRVYSLGPGAEHRLLVYAAVRTADRQYLHVELLSVTE